MESQLPIRSLVGLKTKRQIAQASERITHQRHNIGNLKVEDRQINNQLQRIQCELKHTEDKSAELLWQKDEVKETELQAKHTEFAALLRQKEKELQVKEDKITALQQDFTAAKLAEQRSIQEMQSLKKSTEEYKAQLDFVMQCFLWDLDSTEIDKFDEVLVTVFGQSLFDPAQVKDRLESIRAARKGDSSARLV